MWVSGLSLGRIAELVEVLFGNRLTLAKGIMYSMGVSHSMHFVDVCVCLIRLSDTAVDRSFLIVFPHSA